MALTQQAIEDILLPGAQALGLEIVCVQLGGGNTPILRVFIDQDDGVTVTDCAKASRQFSAILDVNDPIRSAYHLEVSSPGIDRPLSKPKHFVDAIGEQVKIKLSHAVNNRRRFQGELQSADEHSVTLLLDNDNATLSYNDMEKAHIIAKININT